MSESHAEPVELFTWMPLLAVATGRRWLNQREAATGLFIAMSSSGTTGEDAVIDATRMAAEFGTSERTVWRCVERLVEDGWIVCTSHAVRGQKGKPGSGRKARYRLTYPHASVARHMASSI